MAEYIDRKALGIGKCNPDIFEDKGYARGWNSAIEIIEEAPTVDVEPVKLGEWIVRIRQKTPLMQGYIRNEKTFECSCCGAWYRKHMNYCGDCGAKMSGKEVQE